MSLPPPQAVRARPVAATTASARPMGAMRIMKFVSFIYGPGSLSTAEYTRSNDGNVQNACTYMPVIRMNCRHLDAES